MNYQALILADRTGGEFASIGPQVLPALLPIAGKPVLQHCIEDLWEGGVRTALVATPAGDTQIRAALGDGERFGLALRYVAAEPGVLPEQLLASLPQSPGMATFVARGDMLRGRAVKLLAERSGAPGTRAVVGVFGHTHAGIALLGRQAAEANFLEWNVLRAPLRETLTVRLDLGDIGCEYLDGPHGLYDACLGALAGTFAGLVADGRQSAGSTLQLAPRASIARTVRVQGTARVGRSAEVHKGVELAGRVDVGDNCVIDDDAHLIDSIVMPGTYVGRGVRLQNSIAWGTWLYRADLDAAQQVPDQLLLAGLPGRVAA